MEGGGAERKVYLEKRGRGEKEGAEKGLRMGFEDKKNPEKQIRGVKVMRISDNSRVTLEAASRRRLQSRLVLAAFEASAARFCLNEPPVPTKGAVRPE